MVIDPPTGIKVSVLNAKVVIPVVVLCATLSPSVNDRVVLKMFDPVFGMNVPQLILLSTSFDVRIFVHANAENGVPVTSCPCENVIL